MSTKNQLCKNEARRKKKFKNKVPALCGKPQVKGICVKTFIRKPKKPNSANRKVAKVRVSSTKRRVDCYIPGEGHSLRQYSMVLVRGGRVKDLPGIKYHLIRGKCDLLGVKNRKSSRSRYGIKKRIF
jgi:small subunit ribosomal protein S12